MTLLSPVWLLTIYCVLVLLASLAGGWVLLVIRPTHTRLQLATSFVAGLMLGIALLHFLPDAAEQLHSVDRTATWVLGGFLAMFFLQRSRAYTCGKIGPTAFLGRHGAGIVAAFIVRRFGACGFRRRRRTRSRETGGTWCRDGGDFAQAFRRSRDFDLDDGERQFEVFQASAELAFFAGESNRRSPVLFWREPFRRFQRSAARLRSGLLHRNISVHRERRSAARTSIPFARPLQIVHRVAVGIVRSRDHQAFRGRQ